MPKIKATFIYEPATEITFTVEGHDADAGADVFADWVPGESDPYEPRYFWPGADLYGTVVVGDPSYVLPWRMERTTSGYSLEVAAHLPEWDGAPLEISGVVVGTFGTQYLSRGEQTGAYIGPTEGDVLMVLNGGLTSAEVARNQDWIELPGGVEAALAFREWAQAGRIGNPPLL